MKFSEIIGNSATARALSAMADNGRVAHAMLLYENDGCGALALALAYVQYLNCANPVGGDSCGECPSCRQMSKLIHPDVHFVFPVNKGTKISDDKPTSESYLKFWRELAIANPYFTEADLQKAIGIETKNGLIAVAEAKSIITKLSLSSVADGYKAVIFYLPEKMNQETANRLLKLVEEPPEKTLFLFITHAPEKVLQTIFSRCQSIRVMPLTREEADAVRGLNPFGEDEQSVLFMDMFADLMNGMVSRDLMTVLECAESMAALESREKQKAFCVFMTECIRKIFLLRQNMPQIADIKEQEMEFYKNMSSKCKESFCTRSVVNIEKVVALIDRNVSSKMLFCDLVNRMYLSL